MSLYRTPSRSWTVVLIAALLAMLIEPLALAQEATPVASPMATAKQDAAAPMLLFAADGMRPDFVAEFSEAGLMPVMADLAANGVTGENGLQQSFPPNTGTGWATLSTGTWPGVHGSVNNTFHRTGDADFNNRASAYDPGILQAQTIAQAAEQYGKQVVVVGWTGTSTLAPQLSGPAIDAWSTYSPGTVLANFDLDTSAPYQRVDMQEASGWTNVPDSFSSPLEQVLVIPSAAPDLNPDRAFNLRVYDSTDDGEVNYDRVLVTEADAATSISEADTASPAASPVTGISSKDGARAIADLALGDWQDIKVDLVGEMDGLTAGFYLHLADLSADAAQLRLYATSISRATATYAGCDYAPNCADPDGFAETIAADLPSAVGSDFLPQQNGLIDESTYVEQGLLNLAASEAYLDFIISDLGVTPDLLMVGSPVPDEFTHQFLALITESGPGGSVNPRFDDANNDGVADGLVDTRRGYIQQAYANTDALLGHALGLLDDEPNVIVTSDHGFAPQWWSVNASYVMRQAGLTATEASANCRVPADEDPATVLAKICTSGASANIYVNLEGREVPGSVAEGDYEAVRQQIVEAFTSLTDPANPDNPVVAEVLLREEVAQRFGPTAVHPSRTGDVVVILQPPYQFGSVPQGELIAPSIFFGQHGYLPDLVDLEASINMHGTFLAGGPAFLAGVTIDGVEAIDVAPTAAFLMGIPGPTSASGAILYDALVSGDNYREITLISISDYHAQFAPLFKSPDTFNDENAPGVSAPIAGAAHLLPWIDYFRAEARDGELFLTASDIIGATPPLSAFFDDRPAVEMMNAFGLDAAAVGNHHFDVDYQWFIDLMTYAQYPSLAANVVLAEGTPIALPEPGATPYADTGAPWAPTAVFDFDGVSGGVIGITTLDTARVTRAGALGPYELLPPGPVIDQYAADLRAQGVDIVVVVAHEGATAGTLSDPTGPIVDIADAALGVDTVMGDHSSMQVISLRPNGTLLTQNPGRGETLTRTRIVVHAESGEVVYMTADYHLPWNIAVEPDPIVSARIAELTDDIQPILGEQVGTASQPILRSDHCGGETGRLCESMIGNVVSDAMRVTYDADFAVINSGALRADLTCPLEDLEGDFCGSDLPANAITRGQVLGVLPFGNVAALVELNGVELKDLLEAGLTDSPAEFGGFPQISGLCITYSVDRPSGDRITSAVRQAEDGSCTGEAIDLSAASSYTLIGNDFGLSGGDGYPDFSDRMVTLDILDDLVAGYIGDVTADGTPLAPAIQGRITCEGATCPAPIAARKT